MVETHNNERNKVIDGQRERLAKAKQYLRRNPHAALTRFALAQKCDELETLCQAIADAEGTP